MIITVANTKGGVGKSTLAVHLAAWLYDRGYQVILVDCDEQLSSSKWIQQAEPNVSVMCFNSSNDVLNELPGLVKKADYIIADGPGSQTEMSRALLLCANFAIFPCKAGMLEIRALAKDTEVLRQAQRICKGQPKAIAVLSMVGQNYRLTKDMKEAANTLSLDLASTPVTQRQIYADAPGQAKVVSKMGAKAKAAAKEIDALFEEVMDAMSSGTNKKVIAFRKGKRRRVNRMK